jgi:hypothetical protein
VFRTGVPYNKDMEEIGFEEFEEGDFPEASAANAGSLFTTHEGGVWVCEWNEHLSEWVWQGIGPTWFTPESGGDSGN